MNIEGIHSLQLLQPLPASPPAVGKPELNSFQQLLVDGIKELNTQQVSANEQVRSFLGGEGPALHEVMIRTEEAQLSLEFAVQLRNKAMDAYTEIMHMQL